MLILRHMEAELTRHDDLCTQIGDLDRLRRGHVAIACSQALLPHFLPEQVAAFCRRHPEVTFAVHLRDRGQAEAARPGPPRFPTAAGVATSAGARRVRVLPEWAMAGRA